MRDNAAVIPDATITPEELLLTCGKTSRASLSAVFMNCTRASLSSSRHILS